MTSSDRLQIEQVQLRKVKDLLKAILPANSFYARKLAPRKDVSSLEEFSRDFPLTTRHEVVRDRLENPPYGSNLTFPLERSEEHTSELQSHSDLVCRLLL